MALTKGSLSAALFDLTTAEIDFTQAEFRAIDPDSEDQISAGFVPLKPGQSFDLNDNLIGFRLRVDDRRPSKAQVDEKVAEYLEADPAAGDFDALKEAAMQELLPLTSPSTRFVECVVDRSRKLLYIGSTSDKDVDHVTALLRPCGVGSIMRTPWEEGEGLDGPFEFKNPGLSFLGCEFARALFEDQGDRSYFTVENESGSAQVKGSDTQSTHSGVVEEEILSAFKLNFQLMYVKLWYSGDDDVCPFKFLAPSFRVNGLKIPSRRADDWIDALMDRLDVVDRLYDTLNKEYERLINNG